MRNFFSVSSIASAIVTVVLLSAPGFVAAQAPSVAAKTGSKTAAKTSPAASAKAAAKKSTWTPASRTPDGQPDLEGYWNSLSFTPFERPAKYATREFLTDEEMMAAYKAGVQQTYEFTFGNSAEVPVYDATVWALGAWQNGVKPNKRSSVVVDPPDGRIPALTSEAQQARAAALKRPQLLDDDGHGGGTVHADVPADLGLGIRCLSFGGPPILPGGYDSNSQIVQGPGYVMIEYEWNSQPRIIPLDGSAHPSQNIHGWHGDSRGHWEGNTLVVETTNFRPGATFRNGSPNMRITERFTRTDASVIEYKFTIDDPATWTKPWTGILPLNQADGPMFEYACSEGNNAIVNILQGARMAEQAGTAGGAPAPKRAPKKD